MWLCASAYRIDLCLKVLIKNMLRAQLDQGRFALVPWYTNTDTAQGTSITRPDADVNNSSLAEPSPESVVNISSDLESTHTDTGGHIFHLANVHQCSWGTTDTR